MKSRIIVALALTTLLVGCHSRPPRPTNAPPTTVGSGAAANAGAAGAQSTGVAPNTVTSTAGNSAADAADAAARAAGFPNAQLADKHTIYFDYDSSDVRSDSIDVVTLHAHYLTAHPEAHVRLEGNTDERGTREYNIALGERRAQAVKRALALQGVQESQLATVSYGEEHPAVDGHSEEAWAKNRRVEIIYAKE